MGGPLGPIVTLLSAYRELSNCGSSSRFFVSELKTIEAGLSGFEGMSPPPKRDGNRFVVLCSTTKDPLRRNGKTRCDYLRSSIVTKNSSLEARRSQPLPWETGDGAEEELGPDKPIRATPPQ